MGLILDEIFTASKTSVKKGGLTYPSLLEIYQQGLADVERDYRILKSSIASPRVQTKQDPIAAAAGGGGGDVNAPLLLTPGAAAAAAADGTDGDLIKSARSSGRGEGEALLSTTPGPTPGGGRDVFADIKTPFASTAAFAVVGGVAIASQQQDGILSTEDEKMLYEDDTGILTLDGTIAQHQQGKGTHNRAHRHPAIPLLDSAQFSSNMAVAAAAGNVVIGPDVTVTNTTTTTTGGGGGLFGAAPLSSHRRGHPRNQLPTLLELRLSLPNMTEKSFQGGEGKKAEKEFAAALAAALPGGSTVRCVSVKESSSDGDDSGSLSGRKASAGAFSFLKRNKDKDGKSKAGNDNNNLGVEVVMAAQIPSNVPVAQVTAAMEEYMQRGTGSAGGGGGGSMSARGRGAALFEQKGFGAVELLSLTAKPLSSSPSKLYRQASNEAAAGGQSGRRSAQQQQGGGNDGVVIKTLATHFVSNDDDDDADAYEDAIDDKEADLSNGLVFCVKLPTFSSEEQFKSSGEERAMVSAIREALPEGLTAELVQCAYIDKADAKDGKGGLLVAVAAHSINVPASQSVASLAVNGAEGGGREVEVPPMMMRSLSSSASNMIGAIATDMAASTHNNNNKKKNAPSASTVPQQERQQIQPLDLMQREELEYLVTVLQHEPSQVFPTSIFADVQVAVKAGGIAATSAPMEAAIRLLNATVKKQHVEVEQQAERMTAAMSGLKVAAAAGAAGGGETAADGTVCIESSVSKGRDGRKEGRGDVKSRRVDGDGDKEFYDANGNLVEGDSTTTRRRRSIKESSSHRKSRREECKKEGEEEGRSPSKREGRSRGECGDEKERCGDGRKKSNSGKYDDVDKERRKDDKTAAAALAITTDGIEKSLSDKGKERKEKEGGGDASSAVRDKKKESEAEKPSDKESRKQQAEAAAVEDKDREAAVKKAATGDVGDPEVIDEELDPEGAFAQEAAQLEANYSQMIVDEDDQKEVIAFNPAHMFAANIAAAANGTGGNADDIMRLYMDNTDWSKKKPKDIQARVSQLVRAMEQLLTRGHSAPSAEVASLQYAATQLPSWAAHKAHMEFGFKLNAKQRYHEALLSFKAAVKYKPMDGLAHFRMGNSSFALKRYPEARRAYIRSLRACKLKNTTADHTLLPKVHVNLGITTEAEGLLMAACEHYNQATVLNPQHFRGFKLMGSAKYALGDFEGAKAALNEALKLKPDYADAHCDLGCTYCAQGEIGAAKRSFKAAVAANPHHLEAHFNMGNLYRQCSEFGRATAAYDAVLAIDPSHWRSLLNKAVVQTCTGDKDQASFNLKLALKLSGQGSALAAEIDQLKKLLKQGASQDVIGGMMSHISDKAAQVETMAADEAAAAEAAGGGGGGGASSGAGVGKAMGSLMARATGGGVNAGASSTKKVKSRLARLGFDISGAVKMVDVPMLQQLKPFATDVKVATIEAEAIDKNCVSRGLSAVLGGGGGGKKMIKVGKAETLLRRLMPHTPPGIFQHMMRTFNSQILGPLDAGKKGYVDLGILLMVLIGLPDEPAFDRAHAAYRMLCWKMNGEAVTRKDAFDYVAALKVVFGSTHDANLWTSRAPEPMDGQFINVQRFVTLVTDSKLGFPLFEALPMLCKPMT
jgi:tetratricopeptide (TPR) repeat protein